MGVKADKGSWAYIADPGHAFSIFPSPSWRGAPGDRANFFQGASTVSIASSSVSG